MAAAKRNPVAELAEAAGVKVAKSTRNVRLVADGKTIATVWTRANGSLAIYVDTRVKVAGKLKKTTQATSEGLRLRVTRDQVELGELALAHELVGLAAERKRRNLSGPSSAVASPA